VFPAFVRRPGESGVSGNGSAIAQSARQNLVDLHVRSLDADADHSRKETNVRPFFRSGSAASWRSRSRSISRIC
jgi:hypothetical protein